MIKAESEHAFAYETSDGVASAYGLARMTATLDDELRYIERLQTITREQIRDAARKYLPTTAYARIAFVPEESAMSRRAIVLVAVLALLAPTAVFAQTAGVTRSRLPNGLTVVVRENAEAPVVAYSLLVKMGTRTETPDNAGISNMLQTMLVRGTEKMNGEQIAVAADRMGGSIDAYGDADYSEITATALSRNWRPMLELVSDVALRPTVPDGTVRAGA